MTDVWSLIVEPGQFWEKVGQDFKLLGCNVYGRRPIYLAFPVGADQACEVM